MENIFTTVTDWIKNNKWIAIIAGAAVLFLLFGKKLFRTATRHRRRHIPRSVGMNRRRRTRRTYSKGGKAKKPWQVKGSEAARRHMARLRKLR